MPITINGAGTVTGISAGGLPDASIVTADIADANITAAKLDGAQTGTAPIYGCRAWVNFDGTKDTTGATSTANTNRLIRASGNVTSVLRNGTGDYTVTFTTAMADANYAANVTGTRLTSGTVDGDFRATLAGTDYILAGSVRVIFYNTTGAASTSDAPAMCVSVFR